MNAVAWTPPGVNVRYCAMYQFIYEDGVPGPNVELPVVGFDPEGYPVVCHPDEHRLVRADQIALTTGRLDWGWLVPLPQSIPATPGWVAEIWTVGQEARHIGDFSVIAWEPAVCDYSYRDGEYPEGTAIILVEDQPDDTNVWVKVGPMSTRHLPGIARFRRHDQSAFGPF